MLRYMVLLQPELILILAISIAFISIFKQKKSYYFILLGLFILCVSLSGINQSGFLFHGTYQISFFSQVFKIILSLALLLVLFISTKTPSIADETKPEYFFLLFTGTLGMMMLVSAAELLTLYIALELTSYSQYILVPMRRAKFVQAEAGMKYLLLGAAASALTLFGMSFVFAIARTTYLDQIFSNFQQFAQEPAFMIGFFLMLFGFIFKLAGFPLHFWAPDVYEGAATPVVTFIATASKAAAVAVLIKLLTAVHLISFAWALCVLALASITLGNFAALVQKDMKRMLAYSSIAQAGYLLIGLTALSHDGNAAAIFYTCGYIIMNFGAFMVTSLLSCENDNPRIKDFAGLNARSPLLALLLLISLLSLAGIPPLVGFTGKWFLFSAAMNQGFWFLVLVGVINSVISLYYYLMVVKEAYFEKGSNETIDLSWSHRILAYILLLAMLLLGLVPSILMKSSVLAAG